MATVVVSPDICTEPPPFAVLRAYLFRGLNDHETAKKILEPVARLLRTGDPSDSVTRVFKSKHLNDLRLICAVAFIVVVWVGLVSLLTGAASAYLEYPAIQNKGGGWTWVDLLITCFSSFLKLFMPTVAVFGGVLAWAYQVGCTRLGVVDLFACEIDTLCRMITVNDSVCRLVDRYGSGPPAGSVTSGEPARIENQFSSEENYFPVFDGNSRDLQTLEARVVINITAFYTYMKAVRDSMRALATIKISVQDMDCGGTAGAGPWHVSLQNLIYMLFLGLECARKATDDVVEFEPEQAERKIVILISELVAYRFLCSQFHKSADFHYERLRLRVAGYQRDVPAIIQLVTDEFAVATTRAQLNAACQDVLQRWNQANKLLPEVRRRFADLSTAA
jgi:hypothetical protein